MTEEEKDISITFKKEEFNILIEFFNYLNRDADYCFDNWAKGKYTEKEAASFNSACRKFFKEKL